MIGLRLLGSVRDDGAEREFARAGAQVAQQIVRTAGIHLHAGCIAAESAVFEKFQFAVAKGFRLLRRIEIFSRALNQGVDEFLAHALGALWCGQGAARAPESDFHGVPL